MATVKKKKFKDLVAGDVIYSIYKPDLLDGIAEMKIKSSFEPEENGSCCFCEVDGYLNPRIKKTSMGKSVYSSHYDIYATSREEVINASRKFVEREISKYEKYIERTEHSLNYAKETCSKLRELISEQE